MTLSLLTLVTLFLFDIYLTPGLGPFLILPSLSLFGFGVGLLELLGGVKCVD